MKQNRRRLLIAAAAGGYCLLIALLLLAESGADGASIRTLPDALWYSVTTLTTVGYGDFYPVTGLGRVIGMLFQLMSLGVLAAAIQLMLTYAGQILPLLRLRTRQDSEWFIFTDASEESAALARSLLQEDPGRILLASSECAQTGGESFTTGPDDEHFPVLPVSLSASQLVNRKKDRRSAHVFCLRDDAAANLRLAGALRALPCRVYCRSQYEPETLPSRQIFFDSHENAARLYWHRHPVIDPRERIVIVGSGRLADALLEQAFLINVLDPRQELRYTVCGSDGTFLRRHPYTGQICTVLQNGQACADSGAGTLHQAADAGNGAGTAGTPDTSTASPFGGQDILDLREGPWDADWAPFQRADRIIFACDEEADNEERLAVLFRACPVKGDVYAHLSSAFEEVRTFGSCDELCTPELLMRRSQSMTAIRLHEAYRSAAKAAGRDVPSWEELGTFLRRSNLASADHLPVKARLLLGPLRVPEDFASQDVLPEDLRAQAYRVFSELSPERRDFCRELEHMRWTRFHILNNWQYAPVRDNAARLHPLIVPYASLSAEEQAKDDYSWELLKPSEPNTSA